MNSSLETFAPIAARYRQLARRARIGRLVFASCIALAVLIPLKTPLVVGTAIVTAWVAAIAMLIAMIMAHSFFRCTTCTGELERAQGPYCTECGNRCLSEGNGCQPRKCGHCGCTLLYSKGRRFKIRYCSHCGSHLDAHGL